jgi:hypothetical protein
VTRDDLADVVEHAFYGPPDESGDAWGAIADAIIAAGWIPQDEAQDLRDQLERARGLIRTMHREQVDAWGGTPVAENATGSLLDDISRAVHTIEENPTWR